MTMRTLAGLDRFKNYRKISLTDTDDDNVLEMLLLSASTHIINACKRKITLEELTEYYDGNGLSLMRLNNFPVISTEDNIDIRIDANRDFEESDQIDASYIALYPDCGEVAITNQTFGTDIKSVRVNYLAGFSNYKVESGKNIIDFQEGETAKAATIAVGEYTAIALATEIQTKMTTAGDNAYTVTFDRVAQRFFISADSDFSLLFSTGTNKTKSICDMLGWSASDLSGDDNYTATYARPGVPGDLQIAAIMLTEKLYNDSKHGESRAGIRSSKEGDDYTVTFAMDEVPPFVKLIIEKYKKYA